MQATVDDATVAPETQAAATHESEPEDASQSHDALSASFVRRNPFDVRVSLRDPFPRFEDSMAGFRSENADEDESESDTSGLDTLYKNSSPATGAVNLDWSIDTIAELKPVAFSPLSEQKHPAEDSNTSIEDRFFEDEAQYNVLQTPSPLIRQQQQETRTQSLAQVQQRQRPHSHSSASPVIPGPPPRAPTPPSRTQRRLSLSSSTSPGAADLHRRCQDAIAFCEDRLRERDRKLSRLQLPSPGAKAQRKSKNKRLRERDSEFPWKTHGQRGSELKGIHPRSAKAGSGISPSGISPFSVPIMPIPAHGMRTPAAKKTNGQERVDPDFSFDGGSPISPIVPFPDRSEDNEEEEKAHGQRMEAGAKSFGASSPSFSQSDGEERDKENLASAAQKPRTRTLSADSPSFTLSMSSSWGKAAEDSFSLQTLARLQDGQSDASLSSILVASPGLKSSAEPERWSQSGPKNRSNTQQVLASPSIAQRQESFMAAIEAEASSRAQSSTKETQATDH